MAVNFNDIANQKLQEIEPVPLPPVGTYRWVVTKLPVQDAFTSKKSGVEYDRINFLVKAVAPMEDVDVTDYKGKVTDITDRVTFMFDKSDEVNFQRSLNRLKNFLTNHLKCCDENSSIKEGLNASVNAQFLGVIQHRPDEQDPTVVRAQIGNTAPLD